MRHSAPVCERFQAAADLVAKRWTPLILQQLQNRPRRYSELVRSLAMVSERMLIQRLKELAAAGVVRRRVLSEEQPVAVEYELTEKGRALGRVIGTLERWAEEWMTPAQQ